MSDTTGRWRLIVGVAALVAAAIVGLVGYLKLSLEPSLNHQLPYLASAGMALVLLSAVGVCLVVTDQLRTDDARTQELAAATPKACQQTARSSQSESRITDRNWS